MMCKTAAYKRSESLKRHLTIPRQRKGTALMEKAPRLSTRLQPLGPTCMFNKIHTSELSVRTVQHAQAVNDCHIDVPFPLLADPVFVHVLRKFRPMVEKHARLYRPPAQQSCSQYNPASHFLGAKHQTAHTRWPRRPPDILFSSVRIPALRSRGDFGSCISVEIGK